MSKPQPLAFLRDAPAFTSHRKKVIEIARRLNSTGLSLGTAGNVSVRVVIKSRPYMLVTPSSFPYEKLKPRDIILVDIETGVAFGPHAASIESGLHRAIYAAYEKAGAIVHADSHYATLLRDDVPLFCHRVRVFGGRNIRLTPNYTNPGTEIFANDAVKALEDRTLTFQRQHGLVCYGPTLDKAFVGALVGEDLARSWWELSLEKLIRGEPAPIITGADADELDAIFQSYGRTR